MGGSSSALNFKNEDWTKVSSQEKYNVVQNKNQGEQAQQYTFAPPPEKTVEDQKKIYDWRHISNGPTVSVLGANLEKSGFACCSSKTVANVLTERVPVLLEQVGRLSERDEKVVLYNSLKGFGEAKQFGIPHVNNKMIGFNSNGNVKVWINENFGMNEPNENQGQYSNLNSQQSLVKNIVDVIRPYSPDYQNRESFYEQLSESQSCEDAVKFMRTLQLGTSYSELEANITSISPTNLSSYYPTESKKLHSAFQSPPSTVYKSPTKPRISITYLNPTP